MGSRLQNAINFLLYSYFGIAIDDELNEDQIIDTSIEKAYSDATSQGAFNTIVSDKAKGKIGNCKKNAKDLIKAAISKLIEIKDSKAFDEQHNRLCNEVKGAFEDIKAHENSKEQEKEPKQAFTYGNAQKWVNMTLKNLYIIATCIEAMAAADDDVSAFAGKILSAVKWFHTPVDSYIIEALWEEKEKVEFLPYTGSKVEGLPVYSASGSKLVFDPNNNEVKTCKYKKGQVIEHYTASRVTGWSAWNPDQYEAFHKGMRAKPIDGNELDWEGPTWIRIAKKRKAEDAAIEAYKIAGKQ